MADNIQEIQEAQKEWEFPQLTFDDDLNLNPHDEQLAIVRKSGITPAQMFTGLLARIDEAKMSGNKDEYEKLKIRFPEIVAQVREKAEKRGEPLLPEKNFEKFEKVANSKGLTFYPPDIEIPTKK